MSDKQPSQLNPSTRHESAGGQTKNMEITHKLVMEVSDRIYGMLLRELKVERERQRFLNGSQRK
jgi:hypothetical protein